MNSEIDITDLQELFQQRVQLEERIREVQRAKRLAALDSMRSMMQFFDISLDDLRQSLEPSKTEAKSGKRPPVEPKYRGPNGELWSGRGREPSWIKASGFPKSHWLIEK
jgi:DNA-binding protein H-NS